MAVDGESLEEGAVLIVDDQAAAREILTRKLSRESIRTVTADSGRECLKIVRSAEHVDVILLDVSMPEMDGIEVCRELAKEDRTRSIPVILLTALDDHDYQIRFQGMNLGVSEFMTKPVNWKELFTRVRGHLRSRALARQIDQTLAGLPERGGE
ncbi:MAG: hypothetical protein QOD06_2806 [Candidatus Binatota bacterium]|nr:hypothetical protein [Candidatus Binatota bacterium]